MVQRARDAAALVLVDGPALLRPELHVFEAMLDGWAAQHPKHDPRRPHRLQPFRHRPPSRHPRRTLAALRIACHSGSMSDTVWQSGVGPPVGSNGNPADDLDYETISGCDFVMSRSKTSSTVPPPEAISRTAELPNRQPVGWLRISELGHLQHASMTEAAIRVLRRRFRGVGSVAPGTPPRDRRLSRRRRRDGRPPRPGLPRPLSHRVDVHPWVEVAATRYAGSPARNAATARSNGSGCVIIGAWPAPSITVSEAPGIRSAM